MGRSRVFASVKAPMSASRRTALIVTVATIGTMALLLISSLGADAGPLPTASPPQTWTSGSQYWNNSSRTIQGYFGNVSTVGHIHYSIASQITATNTSNTTTQLQGWEWVNRTLSSTSCSPNCTAPMFTYNWSYGSDELVVQFLNLTTNATVYSNGSAMAALGVTNASARTTEGLTETESASSAWGNYSFNETSNEVAFYGVDFVTPLGLIPWNLTANSSWEDRANYTAQGGWNDSFTASSHWGNMTRSYNRTFAYTVNRTGTEWAGGRDFGSHVGAGNKTVVRIGLRFGGPFNFDNNLFMTAIGSDLFQGATANWTTQTRGGWNDGGWGSDEDGYQAAGQDVASVYAAHVDAATVGGTSSTGSGTTGGSSTSGGSGGTTGTAPGGSNTGSVGGGTSTAPGGGITAPTPGQTAPKSGGTTPGVPSGSSASTPSAPTMTHPAMVWPAWLTFAALGALVAVIGIAVAAGIRRRRP
jgi:hypothetical protein